MGIELDVLVGHPEHELLFVATPVARAAGLKDPGSSIRTSKRRLPAGSLQLSGLTALSAVSLPTVEAWGGSGTGYATHNVPDAREYGLRHATQE